MMLELENCMNHMLEETYLAENEKKTKNFFFAIFSQNTCNILNKKIIKVKL